MFALLLSIIEFFRGTTDLAIGAITLSADAFIVVASSPVAQSAALAIAFLAGVSEMLGQSVVLVINRIPLYRFIASLAFTGMTYAITALTWAACVVLVAPATRVGIITPTEFSAVLGILSLAFAPRLLGVFSIAPYIGEPISNALEAWSMALTIFGLHVALNMPIGPAVFCGLAGWTVAYGLRAFAGRLLAKPLGHMRKFISGSALTRSPQQIIDELAERLTSELRR